ncbi:MAG: bacteriocin [bacterium]|nr:bacteriocin [bacterium]
MIELNNCELMNIEGGASFITASFLNAASRAISTIMDIGRSLGSSIRRAINGSYCSI